MSKNLTLEQWLEVIDIFRTVGLYESSIRYCDITGFIAKSRKNMHYLRMRIKNKVILVDNYGMKALKRKTGSGRPKNTNKRDDSDIPSIINDLNEEQLKEIAELWIKEQRNKKEKGDKNKIVDARSLNNSMKARILKIHRTTMYKKSKPKKYKFDYAKDLIIMIFQDNKGIYGSERISVILKRQFDIHINPRTLRHYMFRWGLKTTTRIKKRKSESKNINVKFQDLVMRNFNPIDDNIIATDVSYIPADVSQNNVYLSVAINHKTKLIESWQLSEKNGTDLVIKTLKGVNRKDYICHSDHGTQYSSYEVQTFLKSVGAKTSMGRVGNSLDNREVEYFFGCLKGEYLNKLQTVKMKIEEIWKHVSWYISWYNKSRIQKRLNWKTPAIAADVINNKV